MPRMEVLAAVAVAIAIAYLWMRWDEHRELREKEVEEKLAGAAGFRKGR